MTPQDVMTATGCRIGIADDAAEAGYLPRLLRDNGLSGDRWVGLFDCAGVEALDVASGALWQSEHPSESWAAIVAGALD